MDEGKTKITDKITERDLEERKCFFFHKDCLNQDILQMITDYTKRTGIQFTSKEVNDFVIITKLT